MDESHSGLGKLLPKSIAAKRRRRRDPLARDNASSSNEDLAPQRGRSSFSRVTTESNSTGDSNELDNMAGEEDNSLISYDSDHES